MSYAATAGPSVTESRQAQFSRDGYSRIEPLTTAEDIAKISLLLDPLFEQFDTIGTRAADLAGPRTAGMPLRSPEINETSVLVPALRQTLTFERCGRLARELLGAPVGYVFDHAIYKPPHNNSPTAWHQDEVYSSAAMPLRSIHFWIPLQAATVENGCMWYVPGSHLQGKIPHRAANVRTAGSSSEITGTTFVVDAVDESRAVACPIPAGGATLHHPLTLHYAGPNRSDDYRRAWILHFGAYGKWRYRLHPKSLGAKFRKVFAPGAG
jgi:hypothetical protein